MYALLRLIDVGDQPIDHVIVLADQLDVIACQRWEAPESFDQDRRSAEVPWQIRAATEAGMPDLPCGGGKHARQPVMTLWASCYPLITIGLNLAPHMAFAAARASQAGLGLLAVALLLGRTIPRGGSAWCLIAVAGLGTTTLGFIGMFHAAEFVSPGLATVIANSQPLIAALLGRMFLGERLDSIGISGFLVGFAGIIAIAWPALFSGIMPRFDLGIGYILLAATGVAIGNVALKRLSGKADAAMTMGFQLLLGAVPLVLLSLLTEDVRGIAWSGEFLVITAALALLGTALAYWLWFSALERTSLNQANAFAFLTPLIGLGIGAVLFAERLEWIQFVGVGAVIAGVMLIQIDTAKNSA